MSRAPGFSARGKPIVVSLVADPSSPRARSGWAGREL